ncbi:MAG: helix-turn-helix domain-containing protein [Vicinamibacteria bacterium]|nr:helix-turn-helix domain-containing protein [Vicinamibacteria bacterium]
MKERDKGRIKHERPRGILHVRAQDAGNVVTRYWPSLDLQPFVEHFWVVRWDVASRQRAETVPHPSVHMALESDGREEIVGVMDRRFTTVIEGKGRVVGTKFRPGAFRAFVEDPVSSFTNRRPPVAEVFGARARGLGARVLGRDDDLQGIEIIEAFLRSLGPQVDESMTLTARIAGRIAEERGITRVDQIVSEFGIPLRSLQRTFSEYAGVSPKWIIQRYRLMEAAERMAEGAVASFADLALHLGYADQAHFIRDFKQFVGKTPAQYARSLVQR